MKYLRAVADKVIGASPRMQPRIASRFTPRTDALGIDEIAAEREFVPSPVDVEMEAAQTKNARSVDKESRPRAENAKVPRETVPDAETPASRENAPPKREIRAFHQDEPKTPNVKLEPAVKKPLQKAPLRDDGLAETKNSQSERRVVPIESLRLDEPDMLARESKSAADPVEFFSSNQALRPRQTATAQPDSSPPNLRQSVDIRPAAEPTIRESVETPSKLPITDKSEAHADVTPLPEPRTVHVKIGRIEVRAPQPPAQAPRVASKSRQNSAISLQNYLAKHKQGWS